MIDLDAYLNRIAFSGSRDPTLHTLASICAAHPAAIAFENLGPLMGVVPKLSLPALEAKLVAQRRGGYCFEHNALLRAALTMLGFEVTSLSGRVVFMTPPGTPTRPRTHMLLLVSLPDVRAAAQSFGRSRFIVDVGFGGHILGTPLLLEPGVEQATPTGPQRITLSNDDGYHAVETRLPDGWAPLYRFTLEPHQPIDYEPLNWFTASHPGSIFRHNLLMERLTPQARANVLNDKLTIRRKGRAPEVRVIASADEFAAMLDDMFDLEPPVPPIQIFDRIPKGLTGMLMPSPT